MKYEEFLKLRKGQIVSLDGFSFINGQYKVLGFYFMPENDIVDPLYSSLKIYDAEYPKDYGARRNIQGIYTNLSADKCSKMMDEYKNIGKENRKDAELIKYKNILTIAYNNAQIVLNPISINRDILLNKINTYRRKFAQNNLDTTYWTDEDLTIEAKRIGVL